MRWSKRLAGAVAIAATMLIALDAAAADRSRSAAGKDSAAHQVRIEVLPFTEVRLDTSRLRIDLPAKGGNAKPILVGGTIRSNVPATLAVDIVPPPGAPRTTTWEARALVDRINTPGVHRFDRLLRIQAFKRGNPRKVAEHYTLDLVTRAADTVGRAQSRVRTQGSASPVANPQSGPAGTVTLLIMSQL